MGKIKNSVLSVYVAPTMGATFLNNNKMKVKFKTKDKYKEVSIMYIRVGRQRYRIEKALAIDGFKITKIVDSIYIHPIVGNQIEVF